MGFELQEVLWMCAYLKKSGVLKLTSPDGSGHMGFSKGNLVDFSCPGTPPLGKLLVQYNFLTKEQLMQSLEKQSKSENRVYLGEMLIKENLVQRNTVLKLLEIQAFLSLKIFLKWQHILYEFSPDEVKQEDNVSISFHGIEPFEILQKIEGGNSK